MAEQEINCPKCGFQIKLTEALTESIRENLRSEVDVEIVGATATGDICNAIVVTGKVGILSATAAYPVADQASTVIGLCCKGLHHHVYISLRTVHTKT